MIIRKKQVVFADQKLEADYGRLAQAMHPEETDLYSLLKRIRKEVKTRYRTGRRVRDHEIINVYGGMYRLCKLWSLEMTRVGTVFFSVIDKEIRIVDIV